MLLRSAAVPISGAPTPRYRSTPQPRGSTRPACAELLLPDGRQLIDRLRKREQRRRAAQIAECQSGGSWASAGPTTAKPSRRSPSSCRHRWPCSSAAARGAQAALSGCDPSVVQGRKRTALLGLLQRRPYDAVPNAAPACTASKPSIGCRPIRCVGLAPSTASSSGMKHRRVHALRCLVPLSRGDIRRADRQPCQPKSDPYRRPPAGI